LDGIEASRLTVALGADPASLTHLGVALTFDDATEDHFDVALELVRREMKGVFFVPPARLGRSSYLQASQLRSIVEQGHVIGAHGMTHVTLSELSIDDRAREIGQSKHMLEDLIGHPVDLFAPPGGAYAPGLESELAEQGYLAARSLIWGTYRCVDDRWRIPVVPVTSFVIRRGWPHRTMEAGRLPMVMRWTWRAKEALPRGIRSSVRNVVHRPRSSRGGPDL
jgi:peptidoglycan/xylan/chitin deacetylase (PgdA/CDA1 family)